MTDQTETESIQAVKTKRKYTKKSPTRGGARPNSGRKKGSTSKMKPEELIADFSSQAGMTFGQFVITKMLEADKSGSADLVAKYTLGFAKYFLKDIQEVDITSNGETITPVVFDFSKVELVEWQK